MTYSKETIAAAIAYYLESQNMRFGTEQYKIHFLVLLSTESEIVIRMATERGFKA